MAHSPPDPATDDEPGEPMPPSAAESPADDVDFDPDGLSLSDTPPVRTEFSPWWERHSYRAFPFTADEDYNRMLDDLDWGLD